MRPYRPIATRRHRNPSHALRWMLRLSYLAVFLPGCGSDSHMDQGRQASSGAAGMEGSASVGGSATTSGGGRTSDGTGGQAVSAGGQPTSTGGQSVSAGGQAVAAGGQLVSAGGQVGAAGHLVGTGGQFSSGGQGGGTGPDSTCPRDATDAYQGAPAAIPGAVEAEDFDPTGYYDATEGNEGGAYRTDVDVDIKEFGAGYAVGWMTAGEWLQYTVNVATEGDYEMVLHAGALDPGRTLEIALCGSPLTAPVDVPQIEAWGEVGRASAGTVHLPAGLLVLRVTVGEGDFIDFDAITFGEPGIGTGGAAGSGGSGGSGETGGGAGTIGGAAGAASGGNGTGGDASGGSGPLVVGKFVGNITTGWNASLDTGGRTYSDYWDQVTPENAGKWGSVQSSVDSAMNWATLDAVYAYAEQAGTVFKQHTFVWGPQQPSGTVTEADVKNWMQQFCERYPKTALIDVVNEPPPHTEPNYANAIGGGTNGNWQWITNAFIWARQYCPNAILILNDYNNIEWSDQTQHFIDITNTIKNAGAPIDAVGAQAHGLSDGVSTDTMKRLITKIHDDTGLPVYITEYDINLNDDQAQLSKFREHISFFMETEWIRGITVWGWIYGSTWMDHTGLIRNGTPRPALTWLMQELERPAP